MQETPERIAAEIALTKAYAAEAVKRQHVDYARGLVEHVALLAARGIAVELPAEVLELAGKERAHRG